MNNTNFDNLGDTAKKLEQNGNVDLKQIEKTSKRTQLTIMFNPDYKKIITIELAGTKTSLSAYIDELVKSDLLEKGLL
ncbi:MAG: hypothetical protein DRG78_11135 [Epsilonproteobacteria bacterium]|nr:MAG: hypothetical protein DRG78_11135 [Campylobacterota bacterium]